MSQPSGSAESPGTKDERTIGMLAHLLGLTVLVPLIIWLQKKDVSSFIGDNAKEALNFQIMAWAAIIPLNIMWCIPFIGMVTVFASLVVVIVDLVFSIMGAMAANKGELYRYPFGIRLVK